MIAKAAFSASADHPATHCHVQHAKSDNKDRILSKLRFLTFGMLLLALFVISGAAHAQTAKPASAASSAKSATAKTSASSRPSWAELTSMQQQTLKPLAASWNTLSEAQKRKWLEISKNYHSLPPEGQTTMHSRMNDWVALSPQQRAEARLNFAKTKELSKQLTPEEKKAKWQTYQALSPEEKQRLASKATVRPNGAATAVKPVAPQKLAAVPAAGIKPDSKTAPKMAPTQAATISPAAVAAPAPTTQH